MDNRVRVYTYIIANGRKMQYIDARKIICPSAIPLLSGTSDKIY